MLFFRAANNAANKIIIRLIELHDIPYIISIIKKKEQAMSFLTPTPLKSVLGTPLSVTLTRADLMTDLVTANGADSYFMTTGDYSKWKTVAVTLRSDIGKQKAFIEFNGQSDSSADLLLSGEAREVLWNIESVTVYDYDGGSISIKSSISPSLLSIYDFDKTLTPTAALFSNINHGETTITENLPVYSVTTWQKLDSTHSTSTLFVTDVLGDYLTTVQCGVEAGNIYVWHGYSPPQASQVEILVPFTLDDQYHHFTVVYNGTAGSPYIELIIDGISVGTATVTDPHALAIGDTFWIGADPLVWGTVYTLRGKVASCEIWSEALTAADALVLTNANYNQHPEDLISKTLVQPFLLGDRALDTDTTAYNEDGTVAMTFGSTGAQPTFDNDVPA